MATMSADKVINAPFEAVVIAVTGQSVKELKPIKQRSFLKRTYVKLVVNENSVHFEATGPIVLSNLTGGTAKERAKVKRENRGKAQQILDIVRAPSGKTHLKLSLCGMSDAFDVLKLNDVPVEQAFRDIEARSKQLA